MFTPEVKRLVALEQELVARAMELNTTLRTEIEVLAGRAALWFTHKTKYVFLEIRNIGTDTGVLTLWDKAISQQPVTLELPLQVEAVLAQVQKFLATGSDA